MSGTCPAIIDRATIRSRSAPILTVLLVALLGGCGSDSTEEELMRRVVDAEAAAASADAARVRAEQAVADLSNADFPDEAEGSEDIAEPEPEEQMAKLPPAAQETAGEVVVAPAPEPAPQAQAPA